MKHSYGQPCPILLMRGEKKMPEKIKQNNERPGWMNSCEHCERTEEK